MSTEYGFEIAHPSGEVYAVRYEADGTITGVCGPLHYSEVNAAELRNYAYDDEPELAAWFMAEDAPTLRLLSDDEVRDIEHQSSNEMVYHFSQSEYVGTRSDGTVIHVDEGVFGETIDHAIKEEGVDSYDEDRYNRRYGYWRTYYLNPDEWEPGNHGVTTEQEWEREAAVSAAEQAAINGYVLVGTTETPDGVRDVWVSRDALEAEQTDVPAEDWPTVEDWAADFNAQLLPHVAQGEMAR